MNPRPHRAEPFGDHIRKWRRHRRMSQLDLALDAEISTRHLSFVETGRAQPSREMVLKLAERLGVPLREKNAMLMAAGYAPLFGERPLADPALAAARGAIDLVLAGHEPYPALAIDRHWTLIAANRAVAPLLADVAPALLAAPVNVLRLSLHPDGLARRILNFREWQGHIVERLRHQLEATADPVLAELLAELSAYPIPMAAGRTAQPGGHGGVVVPLRLATGAGVLNLFSTTTVFGTPLDVTLSEIAIESFFPADAETAERLRGTPL